MQVNPTGPGQPREPGAKRPTPLAQSKRLDGAAPIQKGRVLEPADQVEISGAARELSGALDAPSSDVGGLEPDRLREILERIAQGYYERPDVQDQVLRKLAHELGLEGFGS